MLGESFGGVSDSFLNLVYEARILYGLIVKKMSQDAPICTTNLCPGVFA